MAPTRHCSIRYMRAGQHALETNQLPEANEAFVAALREAETTGPDDRVASTLMWLASVYHRQRRSAEAVPLEDRSVDTVVTTWTLCSIPDPRRALDEMRRVLRHGGRLLFVEHGLAPDPKVRWWQDRLTPTWKHVGGGCHLNRAIADLIEAAGFEFERLDTGYMRGPKPMTFMYEGSARLN